MPGDTGRNLKAAVVGCGAIANEHLGFLSDAPEITLAAVCDQSLATVEFAKSRFGAAQAFTDATRMLTETDLDIVHVLTPPGTHRALVLQCLEANAHVICEKPMTPNFAETAFLLEQARLKGRMLVESQNLLFNDGIIAIDRLVADGVIGSVREVDILLSLDLTESAFGDLNLEGPGIALPGGAVHDFLPHLCYLFLHFASDSEVTQAIGRLDNLSGNARVGYDHLDATVNAGQTRGRLRVASDLKPEMFRVIVRGTEAHVEIDLYHPFLRLQRRSDSGKWGPFELIRTGVKFGRAGIGNLRDKVLQKGTYHGMPRMLAAIYAAVAEDRPPPILERDILSTAKLVDQIVALGSSR